MHKLSFLVVAIVAGLAAGCASQQYPSYQSQYPSQDSGRYRSSAYIETAVITGMREVTVAGDGSTSGAGAVVGALVGGVLGHQVGKGTGRDLATLGGAVAGGMVGNEMERSSTPRTKTELTVRLQNGEMHTLLVDRTGYYRMGDRIRIAYQNGQWVLVP